MVYCSTISQSFLSMVYCSTISQSFPSMVYCSTISQLSYLGEISVLRHGTQISRTIVLIVFVGYNSGVTCEGSTAEEEDPV